MWHSLLHPENMFAQQKPCRVIRWVLANLSRMRVTDVLSDMLSGCVSHPIYLCFKLNSTFSKMRMGSTAEMQIACILMLGANTVDTFLCKKWKTAKDIACAICLQCWYFVGFNPLRVKKIHNSSYCRGLAAHATNPCHLSLKT